MARITNSSRKQSVSSRIFGDPPARTVSDAMKLCDPFTPLDPVEDKKLLHVFDAARGGNRLEAVMRQIRRFGDTPTLHFLTGHPGSGKTTELRKMKIALEQHRDGEQPVEVFLLDADALVEQQDIDLEDLLVTLWKLLIERKPAVATSVLLPLWKGQIVQVVQNLIVGLPAQLTEALGKVLTELRIPAPEQRVKLRAALSTVSSTLIQGLNEAFERIRTDQTSTLVLLIDNLEKLNFGDRLRVEHLFVERLFALKDLNVHMVLTVPLFLVYSEAGASMSRRYGGKTVVLPMVKVRMRASEGGGDAPGMESLAEMLEQRVDFAKLFSDGHESARRIARLSGGCLRDALRLISDALAEQDNPPITRASEDRAVAALRGEMEYAIPEPWFLTLRHIAKTNQFPPDCTPDSKRELLRHLFVLEYQNGDPEPWFGVHPVVEQLRKCAG